MVRINLRNGLIISILLFTALCTSAFGKIIFVDDDATGTNDGSSWENAYTFLQDALADANDAEKPVEIRVAQGIYKPDQGLNQTLGNREATFQLINDITLKGGYAGLNATDPNTDPNARDIELYETILSGDLNGNDITVTDTFNLLDEPTRAENSYTVVIGSGTNETTVLDGFKITAGNANQFSVSFRMLNRSGAGMHNVYGSLSVINCTFTGNSAFYGAGMFNDKSNPILNNCKFESNLAIQSGGGMFNYWGSSPYLINCFFSRNLSGSGAGIINYSDYGSAPCNTVLTDCTFTGNSASERGGGMYNDHMSRPVIINCTFSGNWAGRYGGGMSNRNSNCCPVLTNCTFSGNSASEGGALDNEKSIPILINCILWDNIAHEIHNWYGNDSMVNYCNVRGGWLGEGNIDVDPLFAKPGYWDDVNSPDIVVEPNDPNAVWIDGDYHLKSEAGRWDPVSESWVIDNVTSPCIDAGDPNSAVGDEPEPNGGRINMGAYGGTAEASMSPAGAEITVYIQWLGHSSVKVWTEDCIVYVDPQRLNISPHDATFVLVTHTHGDHYSPSDIAKVSNADTQFVAPPDVVQLYGSGQTIAPGQTIEFDFVNIEAVPAYNINKPNHPKSNNWVGFIIGLGGKRIYVAGDTDLIEEMKSLGDIDVAFLPAGGTYTMNATEAAEATGYIKPDLAIPYHWGQSVGTLADAQRFVELARCPAMVLTVGEMISSDNWPEYSPLIAHWELDEAEGDISHDSAGKNHGTLYGEPVWQPAGGKVEGALLLDGIDDYISTDFVLDPAKGSFSVFAWIKGGAAGQAVISQTDGTGSGEIWLGADELLGQLMTGLVPPPAGRFVTQPLISELIITDGQWHHIGFVWDSSYRTLYVDGIEIAKDTAPQNPLKSADGGLYVGAGKNLEEETFLSGLIDDVRIYNLALSADEIETLAH